MIQVLKWLLWPFALLYGLINLVRNVLYDKKWLASVQFDIPVISVGNLSVGGTGKTPHIEMLIQMLADFSPSTLSRGYGRLTKGFVHADHMATANTIGDEPMMYKSKFPGVGVFVSENRMLAIPEILSFRPQTQVILLDDAFQHRSVSPGIHILLTEHDHPFTNDFILPLGSLREPRSGYKRADIIIVSKCPHPLSNEEKNTWIQKIKPQKYQHVYFSGLRYGNLYPFLQLPLSSPDKNSCVYFVSGIARAKAPLDYLQSTFSEVYTREYPDHHPYRVDDLEEIKTAFNNIKNPSKYIVTTEKDAARLDMHRDWLYANPMPWLILPVYVQMDKEDYTALRKDIFQYLSVTLQEELS